MKNILPLLLFLFLGLQFACTPKVRTVKQSPMPVSDKSEGNIKVSSFENFVYSVQKDAIYTETVLDKNPYPIDGEDAFFRKMYSGMNYPPIARENSVEGTCTIQVILNELGQLEDAKIVRDIGAGCGKEALKAVKRGFQLPLTPAMLNGNPIKVRFNIPVRFNLH